ALGVLVGTDLSVTAAGGYLVQLLPGAEEDVIEKIEAGVAELGPVSAALASGMGPGEILQKVLADFDLEVIEEHPVAYVCPCSRERVKKALLSMGPSELRDMVREQNGAEVTCRFCDAVYNFSADELEDMAASLEEKEKKEED
ncbi:MAG: Hsp33 family molecular chaperone HslO, partial [Oscillospiraceae bacterium]|nr:Hsp33 family molecular chaperone HslO [Oscillospiraceae bacterium]